MKPYPLLLILSAVSLFAAGQPALHRYDAGVSRELAQLRKQEIKDLRYDLRFSIPRDKHTPVTGEGRIRFRLDAPTEIVIDFREAEDKIAEVKVNGQAAEYVFRNEHIVLPAALTQAGENAISVRFTTGDQSLNRNDDYLYSLSVPDRARTIFPCFDQPNLKAVFALTLELPAEWVGVSNTRVTKEEKHADRKTLHFAPTRPLSTYLFAFAAGRFEQRTYRGEGRTLTAYYRETDPQKVAQLDTIFRQSAAALAWLEAYTGMPCPFDKQDFIILPGFQFGGMEHVGATLYNDTQLFLGPNPTPDEELRRIQLIAHETAHAWFGNLVTMDWFDDVWTKEVFANHFSAWITEPLFPSVNHKLQRMRTFFASALSEDRTPGTNAIHQELDNLRNAGLIYGQIIYNKAPVVMGKIIELMGEDAFREGIREYLRTYAYSNATWDDLIRILDRHTPEDLIAFNDAWVNRKGMPIIRFTPHGNTLEIRQKDRYAPGIVRPQRFAITLAAKGQTDTTLEVNLRDSLVRLTLPFTPERILPNTDGRAYGLLIPDSASRYWLLAHWHETADETARLARLMLLNENYQACLIPDALWLDALMNGLRTEANPLLFSTITSYISTPLRALSGALREGPEEILLRLSANHPQRSCRQRLLRMLIHSAASPATLARLYAIWRDRSEPLLNETDYTDLAYSLAVRLPDRSDSIVRTQRARLTDPDRIRRFDFIARAMTPDTAALDTLFRSLLIPENRRIEPWTSALLGWLNHPTREHHAVRYIRPALDALRDVQRTGDIFFPRDWLLAHWHETADETARLARLMLLNENYQACFIPDSLWLDALMNGLRTEANPLLFSTITSYLPWPLRTLTDTRREGPEEILLRLSANHPQRSSRQRLLRMLIHSAASPATLARLYTIWRDRSEPLLNERDYTDLAYSLAVRLPDRSDSIVRTQRARLTDPDRIRRFDFIARAMTPDTAALDTLFRSLLIPENRRIEPWTSALLGWLNHPTRERHAVRYIRPALDALRDVQRTGDIFFPRDWVGALLRNHRSPEAYRELLNFLDANPNYPPLLLNKIWQAAYPLYRENEKRKSKNEQ